MTPSDQDELSRELGSTVLAIGNLESELAVLKGQRDRVTDAISYIGDSIQNHFNDRVLGGGATIFPDFSDWPSAEELKQLLARLSEVHLDLRNAEQKREGLEKQIKSTN